MILLMEPSWFEPQAGDDLDDRHDPFLKTNSFGLMNWLFFERQHFENMDKLEEIFQLQKKLNERIGVKLDDLTEAEKTQWLLNYVRAMQQELAELVDSVPWKWWAKYQKFDEQNAKVEIIDLFHFLISAAQVFGLSADDVYESYVKKNKVNLERQDSGYAVKDENDSKHI